MRLSITDEDWKSGLREAEQRSRYMVNHPYYRTLTEEERQADRAKRLALEAVVKRFFKERYPRAYLPAENEALWKEPCAHDFRLDLGSKVMTYDVVGGRNGGYNTCGKKRHPSDHPVHILARFEYDRFLVETGVVVDGYVLDEAYFSFSVDGAHPACKPVASLIRWLDRVLNPPARKARDIELASTLFDILATR